MDRSILTTIKNHLPIEEECEDFDTEIIGHINTVFLDLNQLGIGPEEGFRIQDEVSIWSDYIQNEKLLGPVEDYIYLNVKLLFDPPASSTVIESINRSIARIEWRLSIEADTQYS